MARPAFPHMAPYDIPLFASFLLSEEGRLYQRWEFDVSVGPGVDPGPFVDPKVRDNAIYLTQAKIDAVGWVGEIPRIFEVKPAISLSGFGQLLAYRWYFQQHTGTYAHLAAITDGLSAQYRPLFSAFDIDVHIVRPASQAQVFLAVERAKELNGGELRPTRLVWTGETDMLP